MGNADPRDHSGAGKALPLRWAALIIIAGLGACDYIPGSESSRVSEAKEAAAYQLLDPSAAQFRDVRAYDGAVCGQINGKNRLGAYVGFRDFYATEVGVFIEPELDVLGDDAEKRAAETAHGQFVGEFVTNCNVTVNRK